MRYWLNRGNAPEGPLEEGVIAQLIAQGLRHANVCAEGGQSWQALATVPAFATVLSVASPATPAATLAGTTTPAAAATSSIGQLTGPAPAPGAAATSALPSPDPSRMAARVAGGLSTTIRWHLLLALFFLPAAPVLAFLGLANGQYREGPLIPLVGGAILLVAAFVVGRRRIVADPRGIKPVLGGRRLWSDYERAEATLRWVWVTSRAARRSTRHPVHGRRFHFRRGAPLLVEADDSEMVERFEAFASIAAALAQPARASSFLANTRVASELARTERLPRLGGRGIMLSLGIAGAACLGVVPLAFSIGEARRRAVWERRDAEVASRVAAAAVAEAASAPTYPPSPGLAALTADAVCPLLEGWGEHCTDMGAVTSSDPGAPSWSRYWVGSGVDRVTLEIVDFTAAGTVHRVLDRFAVVLEGPPGLALEPLLEPLTHRPIRDWDDFSAAIHRAHYRMRSDAYFTSYGYGIGCDSEAVTRGDTTLQVYMCTWDAAARAEPSRVLRAGDRVAVVSHDGGGGPTRPAEVRALSILAGTATP